MTNTQNPAWQMNAISTKTWNQCPNLFFCKVPLKMFLKYPKYLRVSNTIFMLQIARAVQHKLHNLTSFYSQTICILTIVYRKVYYLIKKELRHISYEVCVPRLRNTLPPEYRDFLKRFTFLQQISRSKVIIEVTTNVRPCSLVDRYQTTRRHIPEDSSPQ
jgi:hypothetical protein